jgi:hypothetical protein
MKTKNFLIAIVLVLGVMFNVNSVKAAGPLTSDNVTLKITLNHVQTIMVKHKEVNFDYASTDKYSAGVSQELADHIEVNSTGKFTVQVKATDFTGPEGTIPAKDVTIKAEAGSKVASDEAYVDAFPLSTTDQTLITSEKGGRKLTYKVTYDNIGGKDYNYIDMYDIDGTQSVYKADVTYTILPS